MAMARGIAAQTARGAIPRERLEELVAQHLSIRGIAAALDRSPATIRYWLRQYGLETTRTARRAVPLTAERVTLPCPIHGDGDHVRRQDGSWRCARCRAESVTRSRQNAKRALVEEAGGRCRLCGYDRCLAALQFHHLDRAEKRFGLARGGITRSMAALREEAAKCILLCSNCHVEVEMGVRPLVA